MVRYHTGLLLAQAVVNAWLVQVDLDDERTKQTDIVIESYQNCREQGLAVWNLTASKSAYIGNCRNTDQIAVYIGPGICFQGLSDAHYANARYFKSIDDAVKYIEENIWE